MGWLKGGIIGVIVGLVVEFILFFLAHLCQVFLGDTNGSCSYFILPYSLVAEIIPYSERIGYLLSLGVFLIIMFAIGSLIFRKR